MKEKRRTTDLRREKTTRRREAWSTYGGFGGEEPLKPQPNILYSVCGFEIIDLPILSNRCMMDTSVI